MPDIQKPIVLGLDISTHCGWAIWDTTTDFSAIKCGIMEFPEDATPEMMAEQIGRKVRSLIVDFREPYAFVESYVAPDGTTRKRKAYSKQINLVAIETAKKTTLKGGFSTIISCFLHGAVFSVVGNFGIPWGVIADATWRMMHFGKGWVPAPKVTTDRKTGQKKIGKPDWKAAAIAKCEDIGVPLPSKKTNQDNAAEAALVAIVWRGIKVAPQYHEAFKAFLQQRNTKTTSQTSDLFSGAAA